MNKKIRIALVVALGVLVLLFFGWGVVQYMHVEDEAVAQANVEVTALSDEQRLVKEVDKLVELLEKPADPRYAYGPSVMENIFEAAKARAQTDGAFSELQPLYVGGKIYVDVFRFVVTAQGVRSEQLEALGKYIGGREDIVEQIRRASAAAEGVAKSNKLLVDADFIIMDGRVESSQIPPLKKFREISW